MGSMTEHSAQLEEKTGLDQKIEVWLKRDPYLKPFAGRIISRIERSKHLEDQLTGGTASLAEAASGHTYYGLHRTSKGWVCREWAPNAQSMYLIGDMNDWKEDPQYAFSRLADGQSWELLLPEKALKHEQLYRLRLTWPGGQGDRIPAWVRRVVQDPITLIFNAQVWQPKEAYSWKNTDFRVDPTMVPYIYEAHAGMAQEEERVGSFREFADKIIPRIVAGGYNTIQLMAVQEHPYYGSFGYQVGSFFAPSSRFGAPEDLKYLVDTAHCNGLAVVMDIVHSHAASNEVEGIARFDGTRYQFFHDGERGHHRAWDSRCFDYAKHPVIHFLLSNVRYWLEEFKFDGFRFDGVTSMLYLDHGLEKVFTGYHDYFGDNVDEDAVSYLMLATRLARQIRPDCILIAEDVSGMPGLALDQQEGGIGFGYRFAMGVADHWIRLVKDQRDEEWNMGWLWHELVNRRLDEKTISYSESHDQSLVGDQTLAFRLIGPDMYWHMDVNHKTMAMDRGVALHKMIRLITIGAAGNGYMNFIGNEFGHPEWVDFPREGNGWSYNHARRQWSLVDNERLRYNQLGKFDRAMIALMKDNDLLHVPDVYLRKQHEDDKVLAFQRNGYLFVFNFHPDKSFTDYWIHADAGSYDIVLDTDNPEYGGHGRLAQGQEILSFNSEGLSYVSLYLPCRTGLVLARRGQPKPIVRGKEEGASIHQKRRALGSTAPESSTKVVPMHATAQKEVVPEEATKKSPVNKKGAAIEESERKVAGLSSEVPVQTSGAKKKTAKRRSKR